jgi:rubrerythrin
VVVTDGGLASSAPMAQFRGRLDATCAYTPDGVTLNCSYHEHFCETTASCERTVYGRVPVGLVSRRSLASSPLARWLADGAHLEAASVPAFEDLVAELDACGAPEPLVRAARSSADDETRHARSLRSLAHRLGAPVAPVTRSETGRRDPEAVAIDAAVEGCAREAYGAIGAAYQAEHARSRAVREAYRTIAADEARHALLSFRVNEWLSSSLSSAARRRVEEAREQSLVSLAASLAHESDPTLRDVLGLPDATRAMELLSALT